MQSSQPKVSVVIPVYRVEAYLPQCIESVLQQTYSCLQVILVDDGSPDQCGRICDEYAAKDNRVTVIHRENGGLSAARNTGLSAIDGDYLFFIDSDDYIRPDAIQILVHACEKNAYDFVFFDAEDVYDVPCSNPVRNAYVRSRRFRSAPGAVMLKRLILHNAYSPCVQLNFFRTAFVLENQLRFCPGIIHEDELFMPEAYIKAKCVGHINRPLYAYRQRAGSIMAGGVTRKSFDGIDTGVRALLKMMQSYPPGSSEYDALQCVVIRHANSAVITYANLSPQDRAAAAARFRHLCGLIRKNGCFGSRKLRMKLVSIPVYCRYIAVKNRIRNRGRR